MQTFQNYIGGHWVDGVSQIVNVNPSDLSDNIGLYAQADKDQLTQAIETARSAQLKWAATGLEQRQAVLQAIGDELIARAEELGQQLAREEGKPLAEGKGEVYRSGQFFQYYAAEVLRQMGETAASVRPGIDIETYRDPVGVVGIITPWNFPMATAAWKIAPALAFGNAVIWKPANLVPASAWALTEIISRQSLPDGLFNLVMGSGSAVGEQLINSTGINAISFTGSLPVGRRIAAAAAPNLVKLQMEMGSKNALYVDETADLDIAVASAVNGAYFGTGQKCTASSRLVVHEKLHDAFVDRMVSAINELNVDHALKEGTQIGPVVDEKQLKQNLDYVALAESEGCERLIGGERLSRDTEGFFQAPALFINSRNDMRVNREEMFGPMACVIKVADFDEGLATVNDTEFGLTAGIITGSLGRAARFKREARSGCVMVNLPTAGTDYHVPFGGRGNSSYGTREQGTYAREFYTSVKTAYIRPE